jgi:SAM-dependent methyltransferase
VTRNDDELQFAQAYFSGNKLYGDDFTPEQIVDWYRAEEAGYYEIAQESQDYDGTGWSSVHARNFFRHLGGSHFGTCLALGSANGDDVSPIATLVDRYVVIEPAEAWWRPQIGGKPAKYVKPAISGSIDLPDESVDLAICFGVLHHIANVSSVITEIARVCRPHAMFLCREPVYSMGDWRKPRKGLTKNERGFPVRWLESTVENAGFSIVRRSCCAFPPLARMAERLGVRRPFASDLYVSIDAMVSWLFMWNMQYHRRSVLRKFAPTSGCYIARKKR